MLWRGISLVQPITPRAAQSQQDGHDRIPQAAFTAGATGHGLHPRKLSQNNGAVSAVLWDFEQPEQKVSNRPFYTKVVPDHPAAPIDLRIAHLAPSASYRVRVYRTGFHSNDAYTAYIEMGSPKTLTAEQIQHLNDLTRDLPERDDTARTSADGTIQLSIPMRSNDIVSVTIARVHTR